MHMGILFGGEKLVSFFFLGGGIVGLYCVFCDLLCGDSFCPSCWCFYL